MNLLAPIPVRKPLKVVFRDLLMYSKKSVYTQASKLQETLYLSVPSLTKTS